MSFFLVSVCGILTAYLYYTEEPGLWLLFPTLLLCSIVVLRDYLKRKNVFSPLFFFTGFYLIWMCIGFLLNYYYSSFFATGHKKIIPLFIFIGYAGFFFGYHFPIIKKKRMVNPSINLAKYFIIRKNLFIIYFIAFLATILYYSLRWKILFGGPISQTRFQAVAGFGYIYHLMTMFHFFIIVYLANKWFFKKPITSLDWFLMFIAVIPLTLHLHRGPIIWLLISIIFLRHYLIKRINLKKLLIYTILLFCLGAFIQSFRWQGKSIPARIRDDVRVHSWNLSLHLSKSDEIGVPLGIKPLWMSVALLKPGPDLDFASWLKEQYDLKNIPSVTLIGEGFMSYKVLGIILEFFLLGFLVKQFYYRYTKVPSLRNLYLYMILICQSCSAITFGIHKVLISTAFAIVLAYLVIPKNTLVLVGESQNDESTISK